MLNFLVNFLVQIRSVRVNLLFLRDWNKCSFGKNLMYSAHITEYWPTVLSDSPRAGECSIMWFSPTVGLSCSLIYQIPTFILPNFIDCLTVANYARQLGKYRVPSTHIFECVSHNTWNIAKFTWMRFCYFSSHSNWSRDAIDSLSLVENCSRDVTVLHPTGERPNEHLNRD